MRPAERLLARMRATKTGWKPRDFKRLYEGFGFVESAGAGHTRYQHPSYPRLIATVGRHPVLTPGYAADAVRLIDLLKEIQALEEAENGDC